MVVKVYGPVYAACAQRVMVCLLELGVDFELVHVDLRSGEHKRPPFLALQPFGQVPVIDDGDLRLFESRAIIRYLASKHANSGAELLGSSLAERAVVDQWLEVESHNFNDQVYNLVMQLVLLPSSGEKSDLKVVESCEKNLEKVLDVYEERLSESSYLAGDCFSLADLSHLPGIRYLIDDAGKGYLIRDRKAVSAWWERISTRRAWKKIIALLG